MDDLQVCEHDKVYANIVYLTYPGQRPWICRKCLTEGVEVDNMANDGEEYRWLKRKKEVDGNG